MITRVHLVTGGYPRGSTAGHDIDYARRQLLELLAEQDVVTTVSSDFTDLGAWLDGAGLLISYVSGPFPNDAQNAELAAWLERGGRWFALHGTAGGKAARVAQGRAMVKMSHHTTLGAFFLNDLAPHKFKVDVRRDHPLAKELPSSFEVADDLYLLELQGDCNVLLTTELEKDPTPPGAGFFYEKDTALQPDGKSRVLGYTKDVGEGGVAYVALGHCHSWTDLKPFVDEGLFEGVEDHPKTFYEPWLTPEFQQILRNGIAWGIRAA